MTAAAGASKVAGTMKLTAVFFACVNVSVLVACGSSEPAAKAPLPSPEYEAPPKACTEEAKVCPDGSSVARTGPNCEFAPCPAAEAGAAQPPTPSGEGKMCAQDVKECPDGSFVSRKPPSCAFAPCPTSADAGAPMMKACTMDAKICPDGSTVARSGPNCEFAPCPGASPAKPPATKK